jgi:hypothetical protein
MSGLLTRGAILSANSRRHEDVPVPEWGGTVRVAEMSGAARDAWEQTLVPKTKDGPANIINIRARLAAACIVDEDFKLVFSLDDAVALGEQSVQALDRVVKVAQRLNGLTEEEVTKAKGN